jgi:hypothetical protein
MAAISITPANVLKVDGATETRLAGETIAAGQAVYVFTDGTVKVATNTSAAAAAVVGIALNGGGAGQPIQYQKDGTITIGGTATVGKEYKLGTAGGLIPVDDTTGGEFGTFIGYGISATQVKLGISASGVAAAGAVS